MRISPLDIKKQEFTRSLRGYDADEVQAFLDMLAGQWEEMHAEQRRVEDKVRELKDKLSHYQRVEEALQEALQTARESSKQTLENAKQEAALIVKKAMGEAEDLTRSAARQRESLLQEVDALTGRRDEIVAQLRAFLMSEVEILSRFEQREMRGGDRTKARAPEADPATATAASLLKTPEPVAPEAETEQTEQPGGQGTREEVQAPARPDQALDKVHLEQAVAALAEHEVPFDFDELDEVLNEVSGGARLDLAPIEDAGAVEEEAIEEERQEAAPAGEEVVAEEAAVEEEEPEAVVAEEAAVEEAQPEAVIEEEQPEAVIEEEQPEAVVEEEEEVAEEAAVEEEQPEAAMEEAVAVEGPEIAAEEIAPETEGAVGEEAAAFEGEEENEERAAEEAVPVAAAGAPPPDSVPTEASPEGEAAPFFVEEESLNFRFFEPNETEETPRFYEEEAAREKVRFGPRGLGDRPPSDDTWIVRPVSKTPKAPAAEPAAREHLTASTEEIEKIRRILNDLE